MQTYSDSTFSQHAPIKSAQQSASTGLTHAPVLNTAFGRASHSNSVKSKQNPRKQHFPVVEFIVSHVFGQVKYEEA